MVWHSDGLYSRFVTWAKITLPLMALTLVSSLFLFSRSNEQGETLRFSDGELRELTRNEGILQPRLAGVTASGIAIELSADSADQGVETDNSTALRGLSAHFKFTDGLKIDAVAGLALVDGLDLNVKLSENVELAGSNGYRATSSGLVFALDRLDIRSTGSVSAEFPQGILQAGHMQIKEVQSEDPQKSGLYVVVFNEGVKMVYTPKQRNGNP